MPHADPVDGECVDQCDCGDTNPCAEYVFNNSGGVVEGRNFTQWFARMLKFNTGGP